MNRYILSGANELNSGHADYIPGAIAGDYIIDQNQTSQGFYMDSGSPHDARQIAIGAGSVAKAEYDASTFSASKAYLNHYSNGVWKGNSGAGSGNYTGPIGNRIWLNGKYYSAPATNSGGDVLFSWTNHGFQSSGNYCRIISSVSQYAGYKYVEVINANTFKIRDSAAGSNISYVSNDSGATVKPIFGQSYMRVMDMHGTADNKVIITNFGGQAEFRVTPEAVTTYNFQCWQTGTHFIHTGEYDPINNTGHVDYQGHRDEYAFSQGTYGIVYYHGNDLKNGPILNIGNGADNFKIKFTEVDGKNRGFAGIMLKEDGEPTYNMTCSVEDCYIHDVRGEGVYSGNTSANTPGASPSQHWVNLTLRNNRFIRTGVEQIQLGQAHNGTKVENNVSLMGTLDHMAPFFSGQSNNFQADVREGTVTVRRNLFCVGTANMAILLTNIADETTSADRPLELKDNAFQYGRGRFCFVNLDDDGGTPIRFKNVHVRDCETYDNSRNESQGPYVAVIETVDITTEVYCNKLIIDNGMSGQTFLSGGAIAQYNLPYLVRDASVGDLATEFVKSGWEWLSDLRDVHSWFQNFNPSHPTSPSGAIPYTTADVVCHKGAYYKCILNHSATSTEPQNNPTRWTQLFWDTAGVCSEDGAYNGVATYAYPPDDVRLKANSYHNLLGFGLIENVSNTTLPTIYWEYAYDAGGSADESFVRKLNYINKEIALADLQVYPGSGYYVRRVIKKSGSAHPSNWYLIP